MAAVTRALLVVTQGKMKSEEDEAEKTSATSVKKKGQSHRHNTVPLQMLLRMRRGLQEKLGIEINSFSAIDPQVGQCVGRVV